MRTARTLEAESRQVLRGSVGKGKKEDELSTGRVWAAGFHHVMVNTTHHDTRQNTPVHNILWTAPQFEHISQKALGTLPEDGNIMPKHAGATTHK
jgi:hypothetical protein